MTLFVSTFYSENVSRRSQWATKNTTHLNKFGFIADLIQKKQFGFQNLMGFTVGLQA